MSIFEYLGVDMEYVVLGMAGVIVLLFLMLLIQMGSTRKLKKKYKKFMGDTDARLTSA